MNDTQALLKQIETQLLKVPDFGQLQIHVKKHVGTFSNTDYVQMATYRYKASDKETANADCAGDIVSLMKTIQAADMSGSLGFSITFKKGKAEVMAVQDFKKL